MEFANLLSPTRIGTMELRNRVVLPGMDTNRCEGGAMTPAEIAHYAARAEGGAAMIISGASAITWPVGSASWREAGLGDDMYVPGLTALTDAVHGHGARMCMQLVHHGKVAGVDAAEGRELLVASVPRDKQDLSALVDNPMDELMRLATATRGRTPTYHEATANDIAWVISRYADAAGRVQRAGIDAVEIHGAHGYLINGFLSRAYNFREDDYGGSLENRCRLLVQVIHAVRKRVGADFPILVRLNGCEYGIEGAITPEETAATAAIAEAAGANAVHISAQAANPFADFTKGPLPMEVGQYREMAALVKQHVSIPVIAVGRLLPEVAEEMLANGECDIVAMGRQQLADPQLVNKIKAGRRRSVRPCVNCYVCVEQNFFDGSAICAVNPALGNEGEAARQTAPVASPKHLVVVGGGPAGLETARIAAQRGHRVTLLEATDALGGATWFAAATASPNAALVDWLLHEIDAAGVKVVTGTRATADDIVALAPDAVVVATGASTPGMDAVRSHVEQGGSTDPVTVVGGDMIGLSVATWLQQHGQAVTVLERGPHMGIGMAMPRRWTAVATAANAGVTLVRGATDEQIANAAGTVLTTDGWRPGAPLADELRARGIDVHVVGDAADVRHIHGAMHTAHAVATAL